MSKSANSVIELNKIEFDSTNNRINFVVPISTNNQTVADQTTPISLTANAAFSQANAAFNAANNALDTWVRNQANLAYTRANNSLSANVGGTVTGDVIVTGLIRSSQSSGDEGGQIELSNAATNQSLSGNVAIDIYQNRLRIFETSGTNRGVYLDLANNISGGIAHELMKYNANTSSTGFVSLSSGTTAQRPANPQPGSIRYNTSLSRIEAYMPTLGWREVIGDTYTVELLVVAGGGGGGNATPSGYEGGGGGAGGLKYYGSEPNSTGPSITVTPGQLFTVTVGAGGASSTTGGNSSFGPSYTTLGGGYGGPGGSAGGAGGSGGGGGHQSAGGAGTPGQGYPGGGPTPSKGGAGGGAGGAGPPGSSGNGGLGLTFGISGSNLDYAGGGLGALAVSSTVYGGAGGVNAAGTANRGGGGGGAYTGGSGGSGAAGGSGVVIVRYSGSQKGSGGTITSVGGYTIHTFTGSGTFTA
jgi:hypothetical protein